MSRSRIHPGSRLVLLREGTDLKECMDSVEQQGLGHCIPLPLIGGFHCLCDEAGIDRLAAHPGVRHVEENVPVGLSGTAVQSRRPPGVPDSVRAVRAHHAWPISRGEGVGIAIFDTGIDLQHPELAPKVAGGINLVTPGVPPQDDHGHGTRVAGIIAAMGITNAVKGVAPGALLYPVKVLDGNGDGQVSDLVRGLQWVVDQKIPIVNMSLDTRESSAALEVAISKAIEAGVTIVASTGNGGQSGSVAYPAAYPGVIAVTAISFDGRLLSFSNTGTRVDLVAPGLGVRTTSPRQSYTWASGTSMASPFVSAVAALYLRLHPGASPGEVRQALKKTAIPLPGLSPEQQGAGRVDALNAVRYIPPEPVVDAKQEDPAPKPVVLAGNPFPSDWMLRLEEIARFQVELERYLRDRFDELARLIQSSSQAQKPM